MAKDVKPESYVNGTKLLSLIDLTWDDEDLTAVEALDAAVEHCAIKTRRYLGKSKLDLEITFKPGKEGKLVIGAKLTAKVPQPEAIPLTLYQDRQGLLHDANPDQETLPFPREAAAEESK